MVKTNTNAIIDEKLLHQEVPFKMEVSNIKSMTDAQLNELKVGDVISKKTGQQRHNYIVTYKQENHGICLTYVDASVVETVSYDFTQGHWVYNSTDVTELGGGSGFIPVTNSTLLSSLVQGKNYVLNQTSSITLIFRYRTNITGYDMTDESTISYGYYGIMEDNDTIDNFLDDATWTQIAPSEQKKLYTQKVSFANQSFGGSYLNINFITSTPLTSLSQLKQSMIISMYDDDYVGYTLFEYHADRPLAPISVCKCDGIYIDNIQEDDVAFSTAEEL